MAQDEEQKKTAVDFDANPGIDRKVVEEFERLKAALAGLRAFENKGSSYSLDLPYALPQITQPTLSLVLKGRRS
jgi:hypothetical protein